MDIIASHITRLFDQRFVQTSKKHIKVLHYWPCEGSPLVTGGFPWQRAGNAETVSMPSHHHEGRRHLDPRTGVWKIRHDCLRLKTCFWWTVKWCRLWLMYFIHLFSRIQRFISKINVLRSVMGTMWFRTGPHTGRLGNFPYPLYIVHFYRWVKYISWWRHQMETFSALLAICAGNSPVPGEFPSQRPVTRSFDVFFDLRLNKPLSKQS